MITEVLLTMAKSMFSSVLDEQVENLKNAALDAASDTIHSIIAGKQSIEEWAKVASDGVDKIVENIQKEEIMQYLGGKLFFNISEKNPRKIEMSFDLYFMDGGTYKKVSASSDVYSSTFTDEAIEEIQAQGKVEYNLEA